MRKPLIAALLVLLLGVTFSAQAQEDQTPPTPNRDLLALEQALAPYVAVFQEMTLGVFNLAMPAPLPVCAELNNDNLRVSDLNDAVMNGAIYCREIARDGSYLINPGAIGDQRVIERGVLQAYDLFGLTIEGVPVQRFSHAITVCLKGRGDLLFLPVYGSPRPVQTPQHYLSGGDTCTRIGSPGTVVLVGSP